MILPIAVTLALLAWWYFGQRGYDERIQSIYDRFDLGDPPR